MESVPEQGGRSPAEEKRSLEAVRKGLGAEKNGLRIEIATPEVAVLACALRNPEAATLIVDTVGYEDFHSGPAHRLFAVIRNAIAAGKVMNPTTAAALIMRESIADELMSTFKDKVMRFEVDPAVPTKQYIDDLRNWTREWRVRLAIEEKSEMMLSGLWTVERTKMELTREFDRIDARLTTDRIFDDTEAQYASFVEALYSPQRRGLSFGFRQIDRVVQPMVPGNFVQLGGPSGAGKSTIARNMILHWANEGRRIAAMTSEMGYIEQGYHYGSILTGIPINRIYTGELSKDERDRMADVVNRLKPHIRFNDRGYLTPDTVLTAFRRYIHEGYDVLVLDHFHRVDFTAGAKDDTVIRVRAGQFAARLKSLAADHQVVVFALVQLTKMKDTDEPTSENIREANQIVEEADKILLTWRKLVWGEHGITGVFVPYERNGSRYFEEEDPPYPERSVLGRDDANVYLKPGKMRVSPKDALIRVPFQSDFGRLVGGDAGVQGRAPVD